MLRLRTLASHDSLTGALNRGAFEQRMDAELARARRSSTVLALVVFDVDHFKRLNDSFGHAAGDAALRGIGDVVASRHAALGRLRPPRRRGVRPAAPDTDISGAAAVADKLRRSLAVPMAGRQGAHGLLRRLAGRRGLEHGGGDVRRRRPRPLRRQARRARSRDALGRGRSRAGRGLVVAVAGRRASAYVNGARWGRERLRGAWVESIDPAIACKSTPVGEMRPIPLPYAAAVQRRPASGASHLAQRLRAGRPGLLVRPVPVL